MKAVLFRMLWFWRWRLPVYTLVVLSGYVVFFQPEYVQLLADPVVRGARWSGNLDPRNYKSAPPLPLFDLKLPSSGDLAFELGQRQKVFSEKDAALCEKLKELEHVVLAAYPHLPARLPEVAAVDRDVSFFLSPARQLANQLVVLLDHRDFLNDRIGYLRLLSAVEGYRQQTAAHFGHRPEVISALIAGAADSTILKQVVRHLQNIPEGVAGLRAIDAILAASGDRMAELQTAVRGELEYMLEFSLKEMRLARSGVGFGSNEWVAWIARAWPERISQQLGERTADDKAQLKRIFSLSIPRARRELRHFCLPRGVAEYEPVSYLALFTQPVASVARFPLRFGLQEFLPRTYDRIVERLALLAGVRKCIQILQYRQVNGRLPATLSEIRGGAAFLDPLTGRPFGYRRFRDAFMLYGAGLNERLDDGAGDDTRVWVPGN